MTKKRGQYSYLVVNTLLFSLSGLLSKLIGFLMIPLYTGVLSTTEFGTADLLQTTVTLLIPVLTLSIVEAALRFSLSKSEDKKQVFSSTVFVLLFSIVAALLLLPIIGLFSSELQNNSFFLVIIFTTTISEQFLFKFAKGLEKVRVCAINSIVLVLATVISNLILLLVFKMGLKGYLLSIAIGETISILYLLLSARTWSYFSIQSIDRDLIRQMLRYSVPFIPTALAWWINTASDRYIIIAISGIAANGLYSAGSRISSLLSALTAVFQQAWQISGVKEYENSGYARFFSNVYRFYVEMLSIGCSAIIMTTPFLAVFLFKKEFFVAWKYSPFLVIGTLFAGIAGVLAAIFHAMKRNGLLVISTITGALVNIGLNILLVRRVGPIGAAIATAVSFFLVWAVRYYTAQRICHFTGYLKRHLVIFTLLFAQAFVVVYELRGSFWISGGILIVISVLSVKSFASLRQGMTELVSRVHRKEQ